MSIEQLNLSITWNPAFASSTVPSANGRLNCTLNCGAAIKQLMATLNARVRNPSWLNICLITTSTKCSIDIHLLLNGRLGVGATSGNNQTKIYEIKSICNNRATINSTKFFNIKLEFLAASIGGNTHLIEYWRVYINSCRVVLRIKWS